MSHLSIHVHVNMVTRQLEPVDLRVEHDDRQRASSCRFRFTQRHRMAVARWPERLPDLAPGIQHVLDAIAGLLAVVVTRPQGCIRIGPTHWTKSTNSEPKLPDFRTNRRGADHDLLPAVTCGSAARSSRITAELRDHGEVVSVKIMAGIGLEGISPCTFKVRTARDR